MQETDKAEAPHILSGYLSEIIEKGLSQFGSDDIEKKLELANKIVKAITETTGDNEFDGMSLEEEMLMDRAMYKKVKAMDRESLEVVSSQTRN